MFWTGFLVPSTPFELGREGCEVFQVKGHYKIDVPREAPQVNEAEERRCSDNRDFGGKLSGDNVQLREIVQLLFGQHDIRLRTCSETLARLREHGDLRCSRALHR